MAPRTHNLVACAECDALQREVPLPRRGIATCARCGAELYRDKPASLDNTLALVIAATVVYAFANAYPLITLDAAGITSSATLLQASTELARAGMTSVALLTFFTTIAMPVAQLAAMLYMLVPLRLGWVPAHLHLAFRAQSWVRHWAMLEVFLVGALVSLVKLTQVAKIDAGIGIYAVGGYVLLIAAAVAAFEPRALWRRVEALGAALPARAREHRA